MISNPLIWDQSNETIDREELAQLKLERLQASLFRAYRNVAFYRKRFDALGFAPEEVESLNQLRALPFTVKEDLRNGYPYDMLAVPLREVVRLHTSSWAFGRPTVCAHTRNDLRHWNDLLARVLTSAGVTRDDVVQIIFNAGALTSGIGFHGGAERLGASVIPVSAEGLEGQIAILQDFRTAALIGTSSDAAHLAEIVQSRGIDLRHLSLRVGIFGQEPWSEAQRSRIQQALGIIALDQYGLSEVGGPGVAAECPGQCGLHLAEDHFLAEVIDPKSGQPMPDGEEGELVLTTLTKEALPLIRFRTGDLTSLTTQPCACGRTLARIARIARRTDDLIIVQGKKLYPAQLEAILTAEEGERPEYKIILDCKGGVEEVEILVELLARLSTDSLATFQRLEQRIANQLREATGINARIRLVEGKTMARLVGESAGLVVDKRG